MHWTFLKQIKFKLVTPLLKMLQQQFKMIHLEIQSQNLRWIYLGEVINLNNKYKEHQDSKIKKSQNSFLT